MISLEVLKKEIEQNNVSCKTIIYMTAKGSEFIPHQYILEYSSKNDYDIVHIDGITQLPRKGLFDSSSDRVLFFYKTDVLHDKIPNTNSNVWVVCSKIDKSVEKDCEDYIVKIPKLQDWQIKDFILSSCNNLTETQATELYNVYKNDLFRLSSELDKIKLMGNYNQIKSQLYVDVSNYNVFDLTNAIIRRDKISISNIYHDLDFIDVEPIGLITLLLNNFRHIIDVQLARNATAESVGVSEKQFWAIKNYSCGYYSKQELMKIYSMLTDIDYQIKSGQLDTTILVDYIICKIMSL